MNKRCENCGNPHNGTFGTGRFCCQKCSNTFVSNQNKKSRIEKITNTQREKAKSIKYYCISCGNEVDTRKQKYCGECKPFVQCKTLFEKLKVTDSNLQVSAFKARDILVEEYFVNKQSLIQIRDKYKIMLNTSLNFFKKFDINLRDFSEAGRLSFEVGRNTPSMVPNHYKSGYHTTWFGKKIFLRSSYEFKLAKYLDSIEEYYEYEKIRIPYVYENITRTYITDFYLPNRNLILEAKGEYFYKINKEKIDIEMETAKSCGYDIRLLFGNDIKSFKL